MGRELSPKQRSEHRQGHALRKDANNRIEYPRAIGERSSLLWSDGQGAATKKERQLPGGRGGGLGDAPTADFRHFTERARRQTPAGRVENQYVVDRDTVIANRHPASAANLLVPGAGRAMPG